MGRGGGVEDWLSNGRVTRGGALETGELCGGEKKFIRIYR